MKKLAIFDFDGTLFDSVDDVVICLDKTLNKHNFPTLTKKEYNNCLGGNIDETMSCILGSNSSPENIDLIKNTYEKCYSESKKENTKPFPKIHDILKSLVENNILIAINSNRKTDSIKYFTDKFFSDISFILIEGHNPEYPSKPNPIGVNKIIKKADVNLDETVYIGDSKTDISTASNAKIDCLIVKWGYGDKKDWENDYIMDCIDNPFDIKK